MDWSVMQPPRASGHFDGSARTLTIPLDRMNRTPIRFSVHQSVNEAPSLPKNNALGQQHNHQSEHSGDNFLYKYPWPTRNDQETTRHFLNVGPIQAGAIGYGGGYKQ